ncbi:MAG: NAD(+)/NADH kinase, partial [Eubacterium sp.]|nr:NAD(+)/NADH kinase [Eubacterium sp.]
MGCYLIVAERNNKRKCETAQEIKRHLEKNEKCVRIVRSSSEITNYDEIKVVIVLGGDGSVLQEAKSLAGTGVPMLGVNFGTLGFLTEVEKPRIYEALDQIIKGDYAIEKRMAISATHKAKPDDEPVIAFNEIIVGKQDFGHMMTAKVYVDEKLVDTYVADAVLVSTPTGSTAYNLSASGPILVPGMEGLIITPICSHSLN